MFNRVGGIAMLDTVESKEVELIARYRVVGTWMDSDQLPWADGELVQVYDSENDCTDSDHRHYVKFLDPSANLRAYFEMGPAGLVDMTEHAVSIPVKALEFVGFQLPIGTIIDRNGHPIEA